MLQSLHQRDAGAGLLKQFLQNISTRIFLYSMTKDGTYNARSISTLANESFFSDVICLDKEGLNSYPEAVNMPKIIGKSCQSKYL